MNGGWLKHSIVLALRRLGIVATSLGSSPDGRIGKLLRAYRIDSVLDIGANVGQYGRMLRKELGFSGKIFSFEPMPPEFRKLEAAARRDKDWRAFNFAFGDESGSMSINVAANSASSSFLPRSTRLSQVAPETEFIGTHDVQVRTLDEVYQELALWEDRVYLKIDAQGFEARILKGGENALLSIDAVQLEMPLAPMYEGSVLFAEMFSQMTARGYKLVHIIPGIFDRRTGELMECDGVFYRGLTDHLDC